MRLFHISMALALCGILTACASVPQQLPPPRPPSSYADGQGNQASGSTASMTGARTGVATPRDVGTLDPPVPGIYGPKGEISASQPDGGVLALPPPSSTRQQ